MINIILNFGLAIVLFALNGLLGRIQYKLRGNLFEYGEFCFSSIKIENYSGNFFLKIVNPAIFMSICCAVSQSVGNWEFCRSSWMIPLFYWGVRMAFILITQCRDTINWKFEVVAFILSMVLAMGVLIWIIFPLLDSGESVFISPTALRDALWYAIVAYIVLIVWKIGKRSLVSDRLFPSTKIEQIVLRRYDILQSRFGDVVQKNVDKYYPKDTDGKGEFICLVYAVMIYEDYNRPFVARMMELLKKRLQELFGNYKMMTLGIMQVQTYSIISDEISIEFAIKKLLASYLDNVYKDRVGHAIDDYNCSERYQLEVTGIYDILCRLVSYDNTMDEQEVNL